MNKIIICDLDHSDVNAETKVLNDAGYNFKWLHCKTQKEVIENCKGAVVLLNQYVKMDRTIFEALPTVKCVVRYGVGYDNINLEDAKKYGVQACNVPDYGTNEVADQALAFMMALSRKTVLTNNLIRNGVWDYQKEIPLYRLGACTVGICGVGRIGSAFANRVHALGCRVIAYDTKYGRPEYKAPDFVEFVSFEELLKNSDIISIHCPLDENTYHLFDKNAISLMKQSSYLINVARGGIIDEDALLWALDNNKIAGAGIDVVEHEPLSAGSPLLKHDNFLISPHTAWYSEQSAQELKRKAAEEAVRFLNGEPVHYPVN
ncbi:MAG: C-terminal binding protein [Clostridia bacterium]